MATLSWGYFLKYSQQRWSHGPSKYRSHQRCSIKKDVLTNFTKFTGKHLCQSLFFNKVAGLRPAFLLKKRLWLRCFPMNSVKFLRTPFLQYTSGRLLLQVLKMGSFWVLATPLVSKRRCAAKYFSGISDQQFQSKRGTKLNSTFWRQKKEFLFVSPIFFFNMVSSYCFTPYLYYRVNKSKFITKDCQNSVSLSSPCPLL